MRMDAHAHDKEEGGVLLAPPALVVDGMVDGPGIPPALPAEFVNGTSLT